ncbi:unnamed protein product [Gongylonema pulchrum]|uniref:B box-type domain-containing protein n=1 Tax=Gongylonema pulchrum TaxID=637853 RepID=A0A3P7MQS1_9BILA|nr:unnamed protein product [Gongylonema pulchrum]
MQTLTADYLQAFSDEFSHEENGTLRQQVLHLLFNRVQLQPLQAFVCSHMISALEREVATLREKVKHNYSYVCGLMVMLVKICGSRQGLEAFSVKNSLLITLSELLLFAPQVVQCQVLETIERLSKLFKPDATGCSSFTQNLLALIAKVITLQIRDKMTRSLTPASLASHAVNVPANWRIDRLVSSDIGHLAKKLLKDLSEGLVNERWTVPVRTEVANEIMNLTCLNLSPSLSSDQMPTIADISASIVTEAINGSSNPWSSILKKGKFWLAVAALSLLKDPQWLELSPTWQNLQNKKEGAAEKVCDNHDDGRTLAVAYCEVCQCSLCRDCFAVLHLNKRNR